MRLSHEVFVSAGGGLSHRRPPGRLFALAVMIIAGAGLSDSWFLGGFWLVWPLVLLVGGVLCLYCLIRSTAALTRPRKQFRFWLRLLLCPLVLSLAWGLIETDQPLQLRFALSRSSLDEYVRSAPAELDGCSNESPGARQVGLFSVNCAELTTEGTVLLEVGDGAGWSTTRYFLTWSPKPDPEPRTDPNTVWLTSRWALWSMSGS